MDTRVVAWEGVPPTMENIATGRYSLVRTQFVYIKRPRLAQVPMLPLLIDELVSEAAMGETGYFVEAGIVPLPSAERAALRQRVGDLPEFSQ